MCNKTRPTQSRALPTLLLIMSLPGWVSWCQKCSCKTAPNRGPACLINAWGSYLDFSFLPSPSFPQNWASHCACINASTSRLPSVMRGSSMPATSQSHMQKEGKAAEQMKQTSLSSTQCRIGTPLVWGRALREWLKSKLNFLKNQLCRKGNCFFRF